MTETAEWAPASNRLLCSKKRKAIALTLLGLSFPSGQAATQVYCEHYRANDIAGRLTTAAIVANTTAVIGTTTSWATLAQTQATQGFAAQVSSNVRGVITGDGLIAEAKSNQDTQRNIQGDRVAAIKAHQFSTPMCQAATGADISIALAQASQPDQILASRANAHRTAGYRRPENTLPASLAGLAAFQERKPLFCDPNDPACFGTVGARPQGDRMPGALFAASRVETADDRAQAAWVVNNLTMPIPVPALTDRQLSMPGGQELYMRRGGAETQLNLAKDLATDILLTRRTPKADAKYFNSLAAEAGLPQARGNVSQADMDNMHYRDRFTDKFSTRLASLGHQTVVLRELAAIKTSDLQQTYRLNQLLEQGLLLNSGILSTVVEPKLQATTGK